MAGDIRESDWKSVALQRYCERSLAEIARLAADTSQDAHQRYLATFRLVLQRDQELASAFNDMRRSTAGLRLAAIYALGLLTEEELSGFSAEAHALLERYRELQRS
jgi:mannitol-1-phosphate/altronate dehydrogenase